MLGVTISTLQVMVRKGMIQPDHSSKRVTAASFFQLSEVAALADLRFQRLDMPTLATMAMRALAISKSNEKRINQIADLLGLNSKTLSTEEADVVALHIEAQDLLAEDRDLAPDEIRRWANIFYAVTEDYFRLVVHYTSTETPWEPFLGLAQKLSEGAPTEKFIFHKDLESAYGYLEAGRRHLRTVTYFYFRAKYGQRAANRSFIEMNDSIDAEIAGLLYKTQS